VTVPAASDAALGAPLSRASKFQGVIESISGNTITVAGTPGWTANQFVYASGTQPKTDFARIDSGVAKEGLIATIASNSTGKVDGRDPSLPAWKISRHIATETPPVLLLQQAGDSIEHCAILDARFADHWCGCWNTDFALSQLQLQEQIYHRLPPTCSMEQTGFKEPRMLMM